MADVEGYKVEIRRTFALVEPIAMTAAGIFYPTLWEVNPETKGVTKDKDSSYTSPPTLSDAAQECGGFGVRV